MRKTYSLRFQVLRQGLTLRLHKGPVEGLKNIVTNEE